MGAREAAFTFRLALVVLRAWNSFSHAKSYPPIDGRVGNGMELIVVEYKCLLLVSLSVNQ